MQLSEKHKHKQQELSKLSGEEFDRPYMQYRAYMQYMMQDHKKEVNEFEQNARRITDQDVKKWASSAVPVLKEHLQKAQTIAASIGREHNRFVRIWGSLPSRLRISAVQERLSGANHTTAIMQNR
jgi:ribosomal protein L31E